MSERTADQGGPSGGRQSSGTGRGAASRGTGAVPAPRDEAHTREVGTGPLPLVRRPAFPLGGPTRSSWREAVISEAGILETRAAWLKPERDETRESLLADAIGEHCAAAREAACTPPRKGALSGSYVERATGNLDAAELDLLRLVPKPDELRGLLSGYTAIVQQYLDRRDPRRQALEGLAKRPERTSLTEGDRETLLTAVGAARTVARKEERRLRSFRNVLFVAALLLTLAALTVGIVASVAPDKVSLCFTPTRGAQRDVVCPTGTTAVNGRDLDTVTAATVSSWDVPLVEVVGLIAAAVAAAVALRRVRGTSTPYSLPVALALLKLPTGALTAVLGLLLMRGQFVPGLSALDSSAQILAWAVVFGYAQQAFTRLVDEKAQDVLDDMGSVVHREQAAEQPR